MFSIIDAFSGFNTYDDIKVEEELSTASATLLRLKEKYQAQVEHTGENSTEAKEINQEMNDLKNEIVKSKNLLFELKDRLKALQLRVNGQ